MREGDCSTLFSPVVLQINNCRRRLFPVDIALDVRSGKRQPAPCYPAASPPPICPLILECEANVSLMEEMILVCCCSNWRTEAWITSQGFQRRGDSTGATSLSAGSRAGKDRSEAAAANDGGSGGDVGTECGPNTEVTIAVTRTTAASDYQAHLILGSQREDRIAWPASQVPPAIHMYQRWSSALAHMHRHTHGDKREVGKSLF